MRIPVDEDFRDSEALVVRVLSAIDRWLSNSHLGAARVRYAGAT